MIEPRIRIAFAVMFACALVFAQGVSAHNRAVINDPDGNVNVRAGSSAEAAIVAKVRSGETFTFECDDAAEWCKVRLSSGKRGWMHRSRIRWHYTEKDLPKTPKKSDESEIDEFARRRGFDYATVTRRAARGDAKALRQFFELSRDVDGAAAESHTGVPMMVYHILGDQKFAEFLAAQPIAFRLLVRQEIPTDWPMIPGDNYLRRHFPETTKVLFRREIVDWPSPDERFAIRKVFSDEFALRGSKVVRAEVIEKASGKVLADLTQGDIGTGGEREGDILWSPDSRRFAMLSSDLPEQGNFFENPPPTPQRKQTVVYELSGESFVRVDLPLNEVPGRASDTEVAGAILGHEHVEPLRWEKPDVLVLQRHEYYQTLRPMTLEGKTFETVHSFDRLYEITATFAGDGTGSLAWNKREDPP
jgi:hypothetical protein